MAAYEAAEVHDVLSRECGAASWDQSYFIDLMIADDPPAEYRFQGSLGFGGKFWCRDLRVSCYREDETPERLASMRRAEAEIRLIMKGSAE